MSYFGDGNFVSGNGVLGFPMSHHWDARAGYLSGSRFKIYGSPDNIGIRLTQKAHSAAWSTTGARGQEVYGKQMQKSSGCRPILNVRGLL